VLPIVSFVQLSRLRRRMEELDETVARHQTSLDDHTKSLGPLGPVQTVSQTSSSLRGGMTFRAFDVAFSKGPKVRLTTYTTTDGRLEQFLIAPVE